MLVTLGCPGRPSFEPGDDCELNNECAARLVCRIGRCRVECRAQRDCPVGLDCVRDGDGLGACQLPEETTCTLASECEDVLVCRFGRCTNACERDVDCPPGARCEADGSGMLGCRDASDTECALNSDCPAPLICAPDDRCREQCRGDRDCRDGTVCLSSMSPTVCGSPDLRPDAGFDAGTADGGPTDAGPMDAGLMDAGADLPDAGFDGGMMSTGPGPPHMGGGLDHSCAAPTPTDLRCWGGNLGGQIGNGSTAPSPTPSALALSGVTLVGGGASHSCALTATGMQCWGENDRGQLGLGATSAPRTSPTPVVGLPGTPSDLTLGSDHTCAITAGSLYCWGDNQQGQIATGATSLTPVPTPTLVSLPAMASQVSSFGGHTCARLVDGRVFCWGQNNTGQVGTGSVGGTVSTPTEVPTVRGATQVAAGTTHTCAILAGAVQCWGNNLLGQLGDGTTGASRGIPMPTVALAGSAIQVALGSVHSCARTASRLYCWGDNATGQVGQDNGTAMGLMLNRPTEVPGLGVVDEVVAGTSHTCARDGARIRCFGSNMSGQLGDGTTGGSDFLPRTVRWL